MNLEKFLSAQAVLEEAYDSIEDYLDIQGNVTGVKTDGGDRFWVIYIDSETFRRDSVLLSEQKFREALRWSRVKGKIGFRGNI